MGNATKPSRKEIAVSLDLKLYSYLVTQEYRKKIRMLDFESEIISSYKDFKKDEKALSSLVKDDFKDKNENKNKKSPKNNKKIIQLL